MDVDMSLSCDTPDHFENNLNMHVQAALATTSYLSYDQKEVQEK